MLALRLAEFRVELGQDLEEVADEAVIGHLEDRRLLVLVDRDDDCMERPPEMMIFAAVSSGRSLLAIASPLKVARPGSAAAPTVSTAAEPPSPAALKAAVRTVITFLASVAWTV